MSASAKSRGHSPIPRRTALAWKAICLAERSPVMEQPEDKVRKVANRRARITRLPGAWLIAGRPDRRTEITTSKATLKDGTVLPLRVYRPRAASATPRPVVVNFHGGGWVSGDARQSEWWCAGIAAQADAVVVSVEYRLAPERRFPVPAEDCYAATAWIAEHAADLDVDPNRLAVMGDSAGGSLAAVVSLMARDRGGPAIAYQVLIYPGADFTRDFPSEIENANAPCLTKRDIDNVQRLYLSNEADAKDPYASPLRGDAHGLPPALVQTAQHDPLRDHGAAYAEHLRDAGVEVDHENYPDAVHGYISLPGIVPTARQALKDAAAAIRKGLG